MCGVAGQDDAALVPGGGQHDLLQGSPVDVAGLADRVADCADEAAEASEGLLRFSRGVGLFLDISRAGRSAGGRDRILRPGRPGFAALWIVPGHAAACGEVSSMSSLPHRHSRMDYRPRQKC